MATKRFKIFGLFKDKDKAQQQARKHKATVVMKRTRNGVRYLVQTEQ